MQWRPAGAEVELDAGFTFFVLDENSRLFSPPRRSAVFTDATMLRAVDGFPSEFHIGSKG